MNSTLRTMALLTALTGMLYSCASVSTLQTARTTEKGTIGWGVAASGVSFEDYGLLDSMGIANPIAPVGEAMVRYGITDKLDVGLKIGVPGSTAVEAKYMIVGDQESPFAFSAGLSLGGTSVDVNGAEWNAFDLRIPTYASYYPTEWLALYASPQYMFRSQGWVGFERNNMSLLGTSAGLRVGKRFGFVAEYSYMANLSGGAPHTQYTAGIVVGIR